MIRILNESDREKVLKYLYRDLNYNIFPIGDIETFGFDKDFQRVYADINSEGEYQSILLRYREHAIFYTHTENFNKEYLQIFEEDKFDFISGKEEVMKMIRPYLNDFKRTSTYFCEAKAYHNQDEIDLKDIKQVKTVEECSKLYDLLAQIEDFGIQKKDRESFINGKITSLNMGVTLYIEEDNKIVSTVATTAETTKNAMVVAVATDSLYRKKGYATKLLKYLMDLYLNIKDKSLCLFYNNPDAGKIYLSLGFEYIGMWDMYKRT